MSTVAGSFTISTTITNTPIATPPTGTSVSSVSSITGQTNYGTGTGANQANRVYSDQFDVATASPVTVNLRSLENPFGEAVVLASVKSILIENTGGTTGILTVTTDGADGWDAAIGSTLVIPNGGRVALSLPTAGGWVVGASARELVFSASGANCPGVRIIVVGTVAA